MAGSKRRDTPGAQELKPLPTSQVAAVFQALHTLAGEGGFALTSPERLLELAEGLPANTPDVTAHIGHLIKLGYVSQFDSSAGGADKVYVVHKRFDIEECDRYMESLSPHAVRIREIHEEIANLQLKIRELTAEEENLLLSS